MDADGAKSDMSPQQVQLLHDRHRRLAAGGLVWARRRRIAIRSLRRAAWRSRIWLDAHVKRALDLVGAIVLLVLLAPLVLAIAIAIKLEDGGPFGSGSLRPGATPSTHGDSGSHRSLAGVRAQRDRFRRPGAARRDVHRAPDAGPRSRDPGAHHSYGHLRPGRIVAASAGCPQRWDSRERIRCRSRPVRSARCWSSHRRASSSAPRLPGSSAPYAGYSRSRTRRWSR